MSDAHIFQIKDIIFREGEKGDNAYIIKSGQVEILKHADHGEVQLAVLEEGDVFGEMALFEPKDVRSASARALNEVTVDVISELSFNQMLGQTPDNMQLMIHAIIKRLRDTNQRLAAKERASTVLDGSIEKITIAPATEKLQGVFEPIEVMAANLPYAVGGYAESEENPRNNNNELDIPCEGPPLMISQKHLQLERHGGDVFAVDMGARFCTIVNGKVIGRGKAETKAQLLPGENKITLGDHTSPYKLLLVCE